MYRIFAFALIMLSATGATAACSQYNNTLSGLVGLDSGTGDLFAAVTSGSSECGCNNFRFKTNNVDTKMVLAVLMSAKSAGKQVRIDVLDQNNCNTAYKVYIE